MLTQERHLQILAQLEEKGTVSVAQLTQLLGASESTVRRDLIALDRLGKLHKVHGGATLTRRDFIRREEKLDEKLQLHMDEKEMIAAYAAAQVDDTDFVYLDAGSSTLLMIDHLQPGATFVTNGLLHAQRLVAKGANIPQAQATTQPVIYQSHNLFNPYLGYGTFVMPAIIMVIIQQTMLIGIGMIGGTWREFGLYRKLCPAGRRRMSTLPIVLGRGLVYALIYAVTCTYILGLHYRLFLFPMNGATGAVMLFMAAYLAACIAMGIAVSTLFRYRENSLLLLLWTSIPVLMLSGVSYPRQGIPDWLFNLGQLFPSSHGVNGFIRIQTMGASIPEVFAEIKWLIILTVVYGGLACIGIHQVIGREQREHPVRKENGDEGC